MKKVILNAVILDLEGAVITAGTQRVAIDGNGQVIKDAQGQPIREQKPMTFGKIALDALVRATTKDDAEAKDKFALANQINDNLKLVAPAELQLEDADYDFVAGIIARQPLIVKARFIEMVEAQNA